MKKISVWIFVFFLFFSFAYAQPPAFTEPQTFTDGYIIEFPSFIYLKQATDFEFHFHVYHINNGTPVNNTPCHFHLYNDDGSHILQIEDINVSERFDYEVEVGGGNFTRLGIYSYVFQCDSGSLGGFTSHSFEVTYTGEELLNNYLIVLLPAVMLLFITLFITLYLFKDFSGEDRDEIRNFLIKRGLLIISIFMIFQLFGVLITIYSYAGMPMESLLFYFEWSGYVGYIFLMIFIIQTIFKYIYMIKEQKYNDRVGGYK